MENKDRLLLRSSVMAAFLIGPTAVSADEPLDVVATFSVLGDMVERVGGEHVSVRTLVGAGGDAHVYQPSPEDARAVSDADVLVVNGLAFEGWLDRLIDASDFNGVRVVATNGIDPIAYQSSDHSDDAHGHDEDHNHQHGAFDPHAWQSVDNALTYVDNIEAGLSQAAPDQASAFMDNAADYSEKLEKLETDIRATLETVPSDNRTVVTSHDAFQYFGRDYGFEFRSPQGVTTASEASASDVADLIETIRRDEISAVFFESTADPRLLERIADETDASLGGTLYPGALSSAQGPAGSYIEMMMNNARTIAAALRRGNGEDD